MDRVLAKGLRHDSRTFASTALHSCSNSDRQLKKEAKKTVAARL